jgi:hypothetical protein
MVKKNTKKLTMDNETPVKNLGGRKTKWSPALANKVIELIKEGLSYQQAAQAVGVSPDRLRVWRRDKKGFNERVESARELLRAKVLAEIKAAGAKDWRAHAEFLRLCFAEYRFATGASVNVAVQTALTMSDRDPERARLIERREKALAATAASAPRLTSEASADERRAAALESERKLHEDGGGEVHDATPARLIERPPKTVVERDDWQERQEWRAAARRDPVDEILGD